MPAVKLLLIDGNYYVYRSFFAIRELSNSRGEPTNAIYGFVKVVRKMLRDLRPDRAVVLWDQGLPERRTRLQPEYKAQRAEMPELMRPQIAQIRELVPLLGLAGVSQPNTEADDLIAAYTRAALGEGGQVVIATNDKDLFQLVNDSVQIYSTQKTDLASPKESFALLGTEQVAQKWGVAPEQIGDVLALIGDNVDNIPGVPGIGPKRAVALVAEFGSTANLLAQSGRIANAALREKIEAHREQIAINREMVALHEDLPLPEPLAALGVRPRYPELVAALETFEFRTLTAEVRAEAEAAGFGERREGELF